ncbi:MAG: glycosyltransferase, partial [Geminicoccaceae bacterium]
MASQDDLRRIPGRTEVGVVVVTHRARQHLRRCLPPLLASPLRPRVLVVNSSSQDGTVEEAQALGAETLVVARSAFNHGLTREQARQRLGTPVCVMLTPDAYPQEPDFLERLTAPVRNGAAAVAYGRQLARAGAGIVEQVGRLFSYPAESHVRSLADWPRYGSYTHFCSNACAAWSSKALDTIGGFKPTLVSEETIAVAELLAQGHSIAYVAEATVEHSHPQSLAAAFRR